MAPAAGTESAVFVSRRTAAARLEITERMFDQWVRIGFVPAAAVAHGKVSRWHWPSVEAKLAQPSPGSQPIADQTPRHRRQSKYPKGVFCTRKPNGTTYWYYQRDKGKPTRGPLVRLPDFGSPAFNEALQVAKGGKKASRRRSARYNIAAMIADYKSDPQWGTKRPATIATYESAMAPILKYWGEREPGEISVAHVIDLINKFASRPSMGNMVLVMVKKLMKFAVQRGHRADSPARDVDALFEDTDGAKPLTPGAWAALMAPECPQAVYRLAVLGRATGQRISDLIRLRPADRDEDGISHTITKLRDKPHWSLLKPEEAATIDGWGVGPATPYVMRPDGRRYDTDSMRDAWNGYIKTEAGSALAGFTPHDLRATKVCDERIAGKTHQQIAAMVGMSAGMVMKYSKHIDQRLAARGGAATPLPTEWRAPGPDVSEHEDEP
ncbi:hypothetical protein EV667_2553 [Ancylobacter aquaticus]|uniref:Integrase n=1 Tax=Ancylobacter aquaticus TaxID=100 RepID=A0A4V2PJH8_ANCAQ|nr:hypothetical protein [Ancylobacter aquaticus]TCK28546.1 hypothetical protein EV667_2553 [Ancylobacter aquaticus]